MRCLLLMALVGCTSEDAATNNTGPFSPQLCTADPCPVNTIDLGNGSKLTFTFQADGNSFDINGPKLAAGSMGLYLAHPRFEAWPESADKPSPNPSDSNATTIINLVASDTTVLTPSVVSASRMTLAFDANDIHH